MGEGNGGEGRGIVMPMLTAIVRYTCSHSPVNNASRLALRRSPAGY